MKYILFFALLVASSQLFAQIDNYTFDLKPVQVSGLQGIQSFAHGQDNGKWLIVGGRLDGLHRRQPWASFDEAGHNNQLIVVDPVAKQKWSAPLATLPTNIREQLSGTNPNFFQEGDMLYVVGGYGYSPLAADHITYPFLTAIDVPGVIDAIVKGNPIASFFRQITDNEFAVTGGQLNKIYDTYYLVGGHRFDGRYNPMGHPTHTQTYTDEVRKFLINDNGTTLSVTHLAPLTDGARFHRRDFNAAPQIMPNGEEGLTAFSGVFQVNEDLPFLDCTQIDSSGYAVNPNFSQYYNHYHCAHIGIYDDQENEMHTVFFGGIAQYFDSAGVLMKDDNVPFVKTIARVTRDASGVMAEYKLPVEMPALLGAGSEFIHNPAIPTYGNGVIKLNDLSSDTISVGYIFGGISSSAANIFWTNDGTQSTASASLFEVRLIKGSNVGIAELNPHSIGPLNLEIYPNPNEGNFNLKFFIKEPTEVSVTVTDMKGKVVSENKVDVRTPGDQSLSLSLGDLGSSGSYVVTVKTPYEAASQRIIVTE